MGVAPSTQDLVNQFPEVGHKMRLLGEPLTIPGHGFLTGSDPELS